MSERWASVIINNYNYGRFLGEAIESALGQTYPRTEVIVVDDGSTDHSREVIASYGDHIVPVLKDNGGQASALNVGFKASRGDVIIYLDADDVLLPTAIQQAAARLREPDVAKVHWPLAVIDAAGQPTGHTVPRSVGSLPDGDLREVVIRNGPATCCSPPMSGNAWSRHFLRRILPIPEGAFRFGADTYVYELAPFYGAVARIDEPQSLYRHHGTNNWLSTSFVVKLGLGLALYDSCLGVALEHCRRMGCEIDPQAWEANSWWYRLRTAAGEIAALVPPGTSFVLVDDMLLGMDASIGRHPIPFLERDGQYWGPPADDETAIREHQRLRQAGAGYIVFGWPAFWWLEHYRGFANWLRLRYRCVLSNERLVAFDLRA